MKAQGWHASAEPVDVADRASVAALLARLKERAATSTSSSTPPGINLRMPFEEIGDDDWDATIAANLTGPFLLTRGLAPGDGGARLGAHRQRRVAAGGARVRQQRRLRRVEGRRRVADALDRRALVEARA